MNSTLQEYSTAADQHALGSGFTAGNTAQDVIAGIDLTGKLAIVTGGYSGIGVETVRALASAGARVIVPARDLAKASAALAGIDGVEIQEMDLTDPASIGAFVTRFLATGQPLHLLVNSAGIMACPLTRDARGYEMQFATNHLGHFQLTHGLWPALKAAEGARIVSVSSLGHQICPVDFADPNFQHRDYDRWAAYGQSKTANVLFAVEADRRGRAYGIRAFAVHPGRIDTNLKRYMTEEEIALAGVFDAEGRPNLDPIHGLKTAEQGASTSVWCATSPRLEGLGGIYCENNEVAAIHHPDGGSMLENQATLSGVTPWAIDPESAIRLWDLSEELLGL